MASLLFQGLAGDEQEKALGFTMGAAFGLGAFVYDQRLIWRSTSRLADTFSGRKLPPPPSLPVSEPMFGKLAQERICHAWNIGLDNTFGVLIAALSSRGW